MCFPAVGRPWGVGRGVTPRGTQHQTPTSCCASPAPGSGVVVTCSLLCFSRLSLVHFQVPENPPDYQKFYRQMSKVPGSCLSLGLASHEGASLRVLGFLPLMMHVWVPGMLLRHPD